MSDGAAPPRAISRRLLVAGWLAVLVLCAAVRLAPWASARADGSWLLRDGNSYYHLRRIEQTIARGGRAPMFDPELSYPQGQAIQLHAGYDLLVAGVVVLACGSQPDRECLTTTAVLTTPVLGILACLLVLALGVAATGDPLIALLGGLLFALYPFSAGSARIGHVDHHVMEPLLVAAWFLALGVRRAGHASVLSSRLAGVLAGVLAGLAFAIFPTALLPVLATAAALGIERLRALARGEEARGLGLRFVLAATLTLVPVVWTGGFAHSWEPAATSRFHLLVLGLATLALLAVELGARVTSKRRMRPKMRVLAATGAAAAVSGLSLVLGWKHVAPLMHFLGGRGLWAGVAQLAPLGRGPGAQLLLAGLVLGACLLSAQLAAHRGQRLMRLVAWTAAPLVLVGVVQIRFLMVASALFVIVVAHLLICLTRLLREHLAGERPLTRALGRSFVVALFALGLLPVAECARGGLGQPYQLESVRILRRLGERVATRQERKAVLADWDVGCHVLWFAKLPTVASSFVLSGRDPANVEARRALLSEDPEALYGLMERRHSRYLLVGAPFTACEVARSVGLATPSHPAAAQLLSREVQGWSRLRLIDLEGQTRLYELVPGALLEGDARRCAAVSASVELCSKAGRCARFNYVAATTPHGLARLRLPHAMNQAGGPLYLSRYVLNGGEAKVPMPAVENGERIALHCAGL